MEKIFLDGEKKICAEKIKSQSWIDNWAFVDYGSHPVCTCCLATSVRKLAEN
jgi:hypothetical protein